VTFALITARKAVFPIAMMCPVLGVSASGYYAWVRRPESSHARQDRRLRVLVRASFDESKHRYGSPLIQEDLFEQDIRVSRKRVIRLMQEDGLQARARKRFKCTTTSDPDQPVAANLLDRQFTAATANRRWVGDTSEFLIGESGKLYLAAILDLFSRFVVGWAVSAVNDRHLTITALDMALKRRCPDGGLLHHSDQGSPYASDDYQAILTAHGITCSMSRRGNCYDNAVMEAFFSTVKTELRERFDSREEAAKELFEYVEVFYNQKRRHSTLDYVSPAVFERQASRGPLAPTPPARAVHGGIVPPGPPVDRRSWGIL
jgi:putative transposase